MLKTTGIDINFNISDPVTIKVIRTERAFLQKFSNMVHQYNVIHIVMVGTDIRD